jgi:hypothetical protein
LAAGMAAWLQWQLGVEPDADSQGAGTPPEYAPPDPMPPDDQGLLDWWPRFKQRLAAQARALDARAAQAAAARPAAVAVAAEAVRAA